MSTVARNRSASSIGKACGPGFPRDLLYYLPDWLFRPVGSPIGRRRSRASRRSSSAARPETGLVNAARASLGVYTAALELDDRLPPLLLAGEWFAVPWAVTIVCSRRAVAGQTRASNRFARYVSILADQTDVLFERPYRWGLALKPWWAYDVGRGRRSPAPRAHTTPERPGYATTNATALGSVGARPRDAGRQMVRRAISRRGTSVDPRARSGGARHALYEGVRHRRCQQRRHRHRRVEPGRHNRR